MISIFWSQQHSQGRLMNRFRAEFSQGPIAAAQRAGLFRFLKGERWRVPRDRPLGRPRAGHTKPQSPAGGLP